VVYDDYEKDDRGHGKNICMSVKNSGLEKTRMSFSDPKGSDRSAILGRPIAGVDGGGYGEDILLLIIMR